MELAQRFELNPRVIHEVIDAEVIAIHLETGIYYSLRHTGAEVWHRLLQGASVGEILAGALERYSGDEAGIRKEIELLAAHLLKEGLILRASQPIPDQTAAEPARTERVPFVPPILNKYSDMQELLLLDPVHDVAETGWPERRLDGAAS